MEVSTLTYNLGNLGFWMCSTGWFKLNWFRSHCSPIVRPPPLLLWKVFIKKKFCVLGGCHLSTTPLKIAFCIFIHSMLDMRFPLSGRNHEGLQFGYSFKTSLPLQNLSECIFTNISVTSVRSYKCKFKLLNVYVFVV